MRWNALGVGMLVVGLGIVGCSKPENDMAGLQATDTLAYNFPIEYESADAPVLDLTADGSAQASSLWSDRQDGGSTLSPADWVGDNPALTPRESVRHHTVAKGDTLYSLARRYYSDQRRWKDIYAANQSVLANPDLIRVGQELVIPGE